jgi:hypothetical protein
MDNLNAHKTAAVRALLDGSGFTYRYLPSYSPDPWRAALSTLIELAWAKVKAGLRKAAARTVDGLHAALGPALDAITAQDAQNFFAIPAMAVPTSPRFALDGFKRSGNPSTR